MKKLLYTLGLFLIILSFPSEINAAEYFVCTWTGDECLVDVYYSTCISITDAEQNYCQSLSEETCDSGNGYCSTCYAPNVCQPGSCQDGSPASGSCIVSTDVCCLPDDEPPPEKTCFRCIQDFGGNVCSEELAEGEDCGPLWSDRRTCVEECVDADTFESFTCNNNTRRCEVAANGEFTGDGAYDNCLQSCTVPDASQPIDIYCDSNGNASSVPANSDSPELYTAIGCIPVVSPVSLLLYLYPWATGLGGGIAILMIVYSSFLIITSQGNPERVKQAQSLLTAAIAGLLLVLFSAYMLNVIGVDILGIPGLGI